MNLSQFQLLVMSYLPDHPHVIYMIAVAHHKSDAWKRTTGYKYQCHFCGHVFTDVIAPELLLKYPEDDVLDWDYFYAENKTPKRDVWDWLAEKIGSFIDIHF